MLCPFVENAPLTACGEDALDLFEMCGSQLRVVGSRVIGIDFGAAMLMASALGMDTSSIAEFLPELEAGMVLGLKKLRNEEEP